VGAGQDNFQQLYLRKGTSGEEPRFAHSLQLGVLLQTGLVGAFLLGGVLVAALAACLALRRAEPQRRAVAGGALAVFAYWLLHGSVDWFWEFPALAGAAFAMLGLACAVVPRPDSHERPKRMRWRALGAVGLAVAAIPIAASWLSTLEVRRVASTWQERPDAVVERLKRASDLNPLSPRPALAGGAIALRLERPALAREYFAHALERDAGNTFALLDLGLLTAERGDLNGARRLLERALARAPRDPLLKEALQSVRTGRPLAAADVNSRILEATRSRGSSGGTR
jgi:O-antigen ligase